MGMRVSPPGGMMRPPNPIETRRAPEPEPVAWWRMILCVVAVGVIAGFGAVVFRAMFGGIHNLLFLGQFSFDYDANLHTPTSPWGAAWIILIPVLSTRSQNSPTPPPGCLTECETTSRGLCPAERLAPWRRA